MGRRRKGTKEGARGTVTIRRLWRERAGLPLEYGNCHSVWEDGECKCSFKTNNRNNKQNLNQLWLMWACISTNTNFSSHLPKMLGSIVANIVCWIEKQLEPGSRQHLEAVRLLTVPGVLKFVFKAKQEQQFLISWNFNRMVTNSSKVIQNLSLLVECWWGEPDGCALATVSDVSGLTTLEKPQWRALSYCMEA